MKITCASCQRQCSVPDPTPPVGTALVCEHCAAPAVYMQPDSGGASADVLWRLFEYEDRCILNLTCPWCEEMNHAITAPANCRYGGEVKRQAGSPSPDFCLQVVCRHCGQEFCVEWD